MVQAILGHRAIGGDLQSLYQQSRYLPEHAAALQRLADRIDAIVEGSDNVCGCAMRDGYRRLVADAYAEKGIPEEHDDLIKGIADAACS